MKFKDIKSLTRHPTYKVRLPWAYIEMRFDEYANDEYVGLDIDPDFQRGHVWTEEQQIAYVEYRLRGGQTATELLFNHPTWMNFGKPKGADPNFHKLILVDGKQRLEAVRRFMNNELPVFGTLLNDYDDVEIYRRSIDWYFDFCVNDLKTRAEVLQWYLDFNTGGTVHTENEISKVRKMLEAANV